MLRAITFDFWGTLYRNTSAEEERLVILGEALALAGQPRSHEALQAAYRHAWDVFEHFWLQEHRFVSTERWIQEMLAFLRADLPQETQSGLVRPLEEVFVDRVAPRPVPGVPEVLPRLAQRFPLGLISDVGLTPGRVLREVMRRDGLLPHFRMLTFSDETGVTKPLAGPFLRTLAALGARPEEAAHVGDLPETDLAGARGVGMRAILFLGVSHREDGRPLADAVFEEYGELEEIIRSMGR